jgi:tetratricopeptide (TPR) repeat protein
MSNSHPTNPGPGRPLPERPNLEHLKKEAKQRLKVMRLGDPEATLAAAQLATARLYGFASWRRLVAYVKAGNQPRKLGGHPNHLRDGMEAEDRSDYKTAVTYYQLAIAGRPTDIIPHYRLGRALVRQQLYHEALDAFEEVLKLDPQNLPAHYEIGKLHLSARNYSEELLVEYNHENLLAHYEIGKLYLSTHNYAAAIAKYKWLKSQAENFTSVSSDPYELLPYNQRTGDLTQNPFHRAYAAELSLYLLDLIPPEVAEQNQLPSSQIVFVNPIDTPKGPSGKQQDTFAGDLPALRKKAIPSEIARLNQLGGWVILSAVFDISGQFTDIRVVRGLPDGLTRRAIHRLRQFRFDPANIDSTPGSVRGIMEFNFGPARLLARTADH